MGKKSLRQDRDAEILEILDRLRQHCPRLAADLQSYTTVNPQKAQQASDLILGWLGKPGSRRRT